MEAVQGLRGHAANPAGYNTMTLHMPLHHRLCVVAPYHTLVQDVLLLLLLLLLAV
jgi:hypothetical protein